MGKHSRLRGCGSCQNNIFPINDNFGIIRLTIDTKHITYYCPPKILGYNLELLNDRGPSTIYVNPSHRTQLFEIADKKGFASIQTEVFDPRGIVVPVYLRVLKQKDDYLLIIQILEVNES